ncbi:MAG TPA: hypothetical protein VEG39_08460 [Clostridia bacterium]|nr:hypothetical protein [Clostridia bacterium]
MDSLFRGYKISKMPGILSMNNAEIRNLEVKMDREDILEFLNGRELYIMECNIDEIEKIDISEIVEALFLYHEQIKEYGLDDYIEFLQREGRFSAFENEAARIVAGLECDPSKIRDMPENILRTWIIEYLEMLTRERRKNERSVISRHRHGGIGW